MNLRIGILGGGESGVAAALLAKKMGYSVFLSDFRVIPDQYKQELLDHKIPFEEEGHTYDALALSDLIIKSPGVPNRSPIIAYLLTKDISIISEIEFAFRHQNGTIVGITGSNGKSTTTSLVYHILKTAKKNCFLGGNIGKAFSRLVNDNESSIYVIEISSFQLDDVMDFRPQIALLTNITADHLDRYNNSFDAYANTKIRIVENQTEEDILIYNSSDIESVKTIERSTFNSKILELNDSNLSSILMDENKEAFKLQLQGKHNLYNAAMATLCCRTMGILEDIIKAGLETFKAIEHRMESFALIDGVSFINDSKATNIDSVYFALEGLEQPIVWIVGGEDKGNDYSQLYKLVKAKVKAIIILSIHTEKIVAAYSDLDIPIVKTQKIEEAVETALELSKNGDVVLLSPACASFDLFHNYEDRGMQFKNQVLQLNQVV